LTLQQQAEKEHLLRERSELYQKIEQLTLDKETMVQNHTLETGELRKKISILTDRLNESGTNTMSHSGEFAEFANEMDSLTMGTDWDGYPLFNEINVEGEIQPQQNQTTLVVAPRKKESVADSEQPVASGLLLMLLLCGAFVASRSSGSPPPAIRMPDEVREASTTILETVFKDAGVTPSQTTGNNAVVKLESAPSGAAWPKAILANAGFTSMASTSTSNLDGFANQYIAPTKEQEAEQAFSLSAQQYNSLTSTEFTRTIYSNDDDSPLTPQSGQSGGHRRNLAETLKAMRDEAKGQSAAEVYTRSLLWDRIPTEVVREFKRMVEESNAIAAPGAGGG